MLVRTITSRSVRDWKVPPLPEVEHPLEHGIGVGPHGVEPRVGRVDEVLFELLLGIHPHLQLPALPAPVPLTGTLDCRRRRHQVRRAGAGGGAGFDPGLAGGPPYNRSMAAPVRPSAGGAADRSGTRPAPAGTPTLTAAPRGEGRFDRSPFIGRLPGARRRPRPGLVHAPGRPVAPRVPGRPWLGQHPRGHRPARAGGRAHPAAGRPVRDRRRRPLLRHRRPARRHRVRGRRGAGDRSRWWPSPSGARRTSSASAPSIPSPTPATSSRRSGRRPGSSRSP